MAEKQPEGGAFYVLDQLSSLKTGISALADIMATHRARVDKHLASDQAKAFDYYQMLQKAQVKLTDALAQCCLCLYEIGEDPLAVSAGQLAEQVKTFNLMTRDYSTLSAALNAFAYKLPEAGTVSAAIIGRCMNAVRMGYYPTDLTNVEHIARSIAFPSGVVVNLLDPCCGEGMALAQLAEDHHCSTYGIELDEGRAETAQQTLHRVGFGSFFHSRISHEAFHALLLNPPYLAMLTEGGNRARHEKRFLVDSLPHLMPGGLLIYIVPFYRLTADICRILCDNLSDISVHRFTASEFRRFSQVAVMGIRRSKTDGSQAAEALAQLAAAPHALPCISTAPAQRYALPGKPKKVEVFKGAVFNQAELARQLEESRSFDRLLGQKSLTEGIRRPPLPFTFSQLGLIGGSGLINGLIECDYPHIIKGRIIKESRTEEGEKTYSQKGQLVSTEMVEKISNKMIFNILTPQGFKQLA